MAKINWTNAPDPLRTAKDVKVAELNAACNKTIFSNFLYVVNGVDYYFPNDDTAQKNFDKFYNAFRDGMATFPLKFTCYDTSGKVYRLPFDESTFPELYKAHLGHIANNVSYFRDDLELQVEAISVQDGDIQSAINQVNAIVWDSTY